MARRLSLLVPALLALGGTAAAAQDAGTRPHHPVRHRQVAAVAPGAPVTYRGLTVTRPPEPRAAPEEDVDQDGPVRYNDVRDFSPAPYTTSGVQYPYGLDGVGGYGSGLDLEFGGGENAALYDRGANNRP